MSRLELITPEGLRVDGRRPKETRRIYSRTDLLAADGSSYIEMGNTKLITTVYGPKESKNNNSNSIINVEFHLASFASGSTAKKLRNDKKLMENSIAIRDIFESVLIKSFGRSEIDVFIQVLQSDGGVLAAAINGTCLALIDAGIPITDYVTACTAGYCNEQAILDLNYIEESSEVPCLTVALTPKNEKILLMNMEHRLHLDNFDSVLSLAKTGCQTIYESLDECIRK
ncbi:Exosome complex component RRP41 [Boothiomyces macroporosus]|uniref:Ribosomal RNA-processing protein 41 n=1 Tax=Boothiomyces macroporosus TaxID=261099 RepID=A0AAD5Y5X1_9FUNG|nr:Exosome complex component RRP41 [Boothiomyces macroporosus]